MFDYGEATLKTLTSKTAKEEVFDLYLLKLSLTDIVDRPTVDEVNIRNPVEIVDPVHNTEVIIEINQDTVFKGSVAFRYRRLPLSAVMASEITIPQGDPISIISGLTGIRADELEIVYLAGVPIRVKAKADSLLYTGSASIVVQEVPA